MVKRWKKLIGIGLFEFAIVVLYAFEFSKHDVEVE